MNLALLIIDMQKDFFKGNSEESMKKASDYINQAVNIFREHNKKIIWIQNENIEEGLITVTPGFEVIELLTPQQNEKRITKHYRNSFNKTGLLEYLLEEKIDTVIVTGFCAEYCVFSTFVGALDHDLTPIILKNAIAGGNNENIKFVENVCDTLTVKILKKIIKDK